MQLVDSYSYNSEQNGSMFRHFYNLLNFLRVGYNQEHK